jgi:hypothetical protein
MAAPCRETAWQSWSRSGLNSKGTRQDPDADTGGRWLESKMFINNPKGIGKRMVVDRQKVKTRENKRHLEGVEKITKTDETDQCVTMLCVNALLTC